MPKLASSGLEPEKDFYLAYAPERITPGKGLIEFYENPRIIGGIGPNSTKLAAKLFRTVCKKVTETDVATAEISKVAENTFRDVNIAFANQLALICEQHGADITEVTEIANSHPRVNILMSGPGVGGPCLTKDPYLLIHQTTAQNQNIITSSRKVNDYMPYHVVKLILKALKLVTKSIKNSQITVLGTAYKADVSDSRFSPAEPVIHQLIHKGAKIVVYDPHSTATFGAQKASSLYEAAKGSDCLVFMTDHTTLQNLKLSEIKTLMNNNPVIIDGKRIIDPQNAEKMGFVYYGVGYGKPRNQQ